VIGPGVRPVDFEATVRDHVNSVLSNLITKANEIYPQAIAQLFKNHKKLVELRAQFKQPSLRFSALSRMLEVGPLKPAHIPPSGEQERAHGAQALLALISKAFLVHNSGAESCNETD
jgi:hypothetical protein